MPPLLTFYYLCSINPQKIMEILRDYYYSNHASASLSNHWITDGNGNAIQHLQNLPFGEDWVDERSTTWNSRYTFTGKEKDTETGYHYFGARYYDSSLSIWLSVDPMSDKYPSMSPYNYCANNPVILVDPDGREVRIYYKTKTGIAKLFEKPKYIVYTPGMQYNGNNGFVKGTVEALNYTYKADKSNTISTLAKDPDKIVKIKESFFKKASYIGILNTVYFHNEAGMYCLDDKGEITGKQTPALGLLHELGHASIDFYKTIFEKIKLSSSDNQYGTKEERFIIENIETPAAIELGEDIRCNHFGLPLETLHSTTTKDE